MEPIMQLLRMFLSSAAHTPLWRHFHIFHIDIHFSSLCLCPLLPFSILSSILPFWKVSAKLQTFLFAEVNSWSWTESEACGCKWDNTQSHTHQNTQKHIRPYHSLEPAADQTYRWTSDLNPAAQHLHLYSTQTHTHTHTNTHTHTHTHTHTTLTDTTILGVTYELTSWPLLTSQQQFSTLILYRFTLKDQCHGFYALLTVTLQVANTSSYTPFPGL